MAKCSKCNNPIKWIKLKSGKNNPVDPELYNIQDNLVEKDLIVVNEATGEVGKLSKLENGYISHFSTCPYAENFRKKKVSETNNYNFRIKFEGEMFVSIRANSEDEAKKLCIDNINAKMILEKGVLNENILSDYVFDPKLNKNVIKEI